ncbi:MAG TPA: ABC transporter ATP-binding protein [Polyangiaceae bacterium]|nr:ABC transporter ATP-binding protein [Polyangiaceae bacterium]
MSNEVVRPAAAAAREPAGTVVAGAVARAGDPGSHAFRRHLWPLLWRCRWHIGIASLLCGIHGGAMALQNLYPKWFFSNVIEARDIDMRERWRRVAWLGLGYLAVSVVMRMGFWHTGYRFFTWARERIAFNLRAQFFRHVNHLCLRFHGQHSSGELFSYLFGTPLANVLQFFQHVSVFVPGAAVTVLWTLAVLWVWDPVTGGFLTFTSACSVLLMIHSRLRVQRIHRDFQSVEGDVSGRVADVLRGNKAVKLYAMEEQVLEDFEAQALFIGKKSYERDVLSHVEWMKQEGFSYVCYVALMAMCTWRAYRGIIGTGVVVSCFTSFQGVYGPLQLLFQSFMLWGGAAASLERIGKVLDTASTTPDPVDPVRVVPSRAAIEFQGVSFAYEADSPVLSGVDLTVPYGQRVALVGPSGAGKTTIAQLALRLYDPGQGVVRIGGIDVRRFTGAELRKHIGVVPQDPFIFRATVRDNVRVSRPEAPDAAIRRACELANAWEFVAELPGRLDARLGEGGSSLSGGQRQRLAIARALLADPDIFIFDEATSALDTVSEKLIQDALDKCLGGRTAVFIAHRLATVRNCDRILVVDAGRVVQDGTYDELIERGGLFGALVRGQTLRA